MTNQELFDRVATHLLTQNAKSQGPEGDCRYRGYNGRKCAIGCLIPDDKYDPYWDYRGLSIGPKFNDDWGRDARLALLEATGIASGQQEFAFGLQGIHDNTDVADWLDSLRAFADANGISPAILDRYIKEPNQCTTEVN